MKPDEIARLRELDKGRTQGEWIYSPESRDEAAAIFVRDDSLHPRIVAEEMLARDAEYAVAACNALPRLLDELAECRKREKAYRKVVSTAEHIVYSGGSGAMNRHEVRLFLALQELNDGPETSCETAQRGGDGE